jgi:dihydropteroate synthase
MQELILKRMGVMNITPNSFSDGGEIKSVNIEQKIVSFTHCDAIDVGAESTAPMNASLDWEVEWERLLPVLPYLKSFPGSISLDTYHPETIEEFLKYYQVHGFSQPLIWNDVSGKFDGFVHDFLSLSPTFSYVFCHNLAPTRKLTGRHMDYVESHLHLKEFFEGKNHPQVIFDPCLGFSKSYEQNWWILGHLEEILPWHNRWLLGFSRKSFFRKHFGLSLEQRSELDQKHTEFLQGLRPKLKTVNGGEIWIRSHRPELID